MAPGPSVSCVLLLVVCERGFIYLYFETHRSFFEVPNKFPECSALNHRGSRRGRDWSDLVSIQRRWTPEFGYALLVEASSIDVQYLVT